MNAPSIVATQRGVSQNVPIAPDPIGFGARGPAVAALQDMLNNAGASPRLSVDGAHGVRTRAALASYQRTAGLVVTGLADAETMVSLAADAVDTDEPAYKFIQARNYQPGRTEPVSLIVIHSTENSIAPGVAAAVARWFASAAAPMASTHFTIGPDEIVQSVHEDDTAWHAPPCNARSIGVEHVGRASFTREQWSTPEAMAELRRSAVLVADICRRYDIPVVLLDAAALQRGESGITTHDAVSKAFRQSNHWDIGTGWPMDDYLDMVRASLAGSPA